MQTSTNETALSLEQENALAHAVQSNVPFVSRPFAELGKSLGITEREVLAQLERWRGEAKLREISAILEGSALGYDSALVAGQVPVERLDEVAEIVNGHPTVTHNYLRNHAYNLWFTIAVPHQMGLEKTLSLLAARAGMDILTFRPRTTELLQVGFLRLDGKDRGQGVYRVVPRDELRAALEAEAAALEAGDQMMLRL